MHFAEQNVGPIAPSGSQLFCVLFGLGWGLERLFLTRLISDYCPRSCRKRNITLWWNLVLAVWNQGPLGLHDWGIICYSFKLKGVIYTCIGNLVKLPMQITTAHLHNLASSIKLDCRHYRVFLGFEVCFEFLSDSFEYVFFVDVLPVFSCSNLHGFRLQIFSFSVYLLSGLPNVNSQCW